MGGGVKEQHRAKIILLVLLMIMTLDEGFILNSNLSGLDVCVMLCSFIGKKIWMGYLVEWVGMLPND